ncbi:MAG: hypothetical protein GF331_03895 [Chitinivibrionales bacterium]|nr:hypothetical protein [Chitinivibrionales bacterium]
MNKELAQLRTHLTRKHAGTIAFVRAADSVLRGKAEPTAENAGQYGRNVYIASHDVYDPSPADLVTGVTIAIGAIEALGTVELRCYAKGRQACVALFRGDRVVSKVLTHDPVALPSHGQAYDEGLFTWFGPVEDICTPWSDNDPPHCQVLTVEDLRVFGAGMS